MKLLAFLMLWTSVLGVIDFPGPRFVTVNPAGNAATWTSSPLRNAEVVTYNGSQSHLLQNVQKQPDL